MKYIVIIVSLCLLLISGVQKMTLDDLSLIQGLGFDPYEPGLIKGIAVSPIYEKDQPVKDDILTAVSDISRDIISDLEKQSDSPLGRGKLTTVIFNKVLAERGISEQIDALQRDPKVGSRIYLAISRNKAEEVLSKYYGRKGTPYFISSMIEQNIEYGDLPRTNLHVFLFLLNLTGGDVYLPILSLNRKDSIEIDGLALFKGQTMIGEIGRDHLFFFKLLTDGHVKGEHTVTLKEKTKAAIRSIASKRTFSLINNDIHDVKYTIKVTGIIEEYTGNKLDRKKLKGIERKFEKDIKNKCTELIHTFRDLKIDPLAISEQIEWKTGHYNKEDLYRDYDQLKVDFDVDVNITQSGVIE
ncbi:MULTISPECIES: Ger(x)C family spore germination protein [Bacillus]|uniref:Uncharacterized protein n=2 Tax=Bacillus TaxID=1386 RepID=A0A0M4G788_9BACI|nr:MULTISPECIES: Ger(x)C family spore germination protein [Bacillus]ALC80865.1 hypothetical protein AM592_04150 [Bacillus gobiensis]MBP1079801.1 spore germination protein [Bacillus capparidis]MED1095193.1 Ger(x)C family spore germination protein [Bacillus capparidis]